MVCPTCHAERVEGVAPCEHCGAPPPDSERERKMAARIRDPQPLNLPYRQGP